MRRIILTVWLLAFGLTCAADTDTEKDRMEREATKLFVEHEEIATNIPDLVCQVESQRTIFHTTPGLETNVSTSSDMLRVKNGGLYINSPGADEYLYGELRSTEWMRFETRFKTLIFHDQDYTIGIEIHSDAVGTRVRRLRCVQT